MTRTKICKRTAGVVQIAAITGETDSSTMEGESKKERGSKMINAVCDLGTHLCDTITRNPQHKRYDCIVLDLDGSLVYSSNKNYGAGERIMFKNMYGEEENLWVHKRPGFDMFLEKCFGLSTVGVWSMGQPGYVEAIVSLFPHRPSFVYNWCDCDREPGRRFKQLDNIPHHGSVVMIDDKRDTLKETGSVDTMIMPEWHPRQEKDRTLYHLIPILCM